MKWTRRDDAHGRHVADARKWRRQTRGQDWHLHRTGRHKGKRVYVWVCPVPGQRRTYRHLTIAGTEGSVSLLAFLRSALATHRATVTGYLLQGMGQIDR